MLSNLLVLALSVAPSPQARAAFDRGEGYLSSGKYDDAANAYREAIAATPGYAEALNGLGSALFKQGKKDEAVAQFQAAIAADANFKLAYYNLGYATRKTGDFVTAAGAYEKCTRLDPSELDCWYGLGEAYRQSNEPKKAIGAYNTYIAKEKRPSEQKWVEKARGYIADLNEKLSRPSTAAQATTPAAVTPTQPANMPSTTTVTQPQPQQTGGSPGTAAPSLAQRRIEEGKRLMQDKKYRDASFAFQDASNADPQNVEALFWLGNAYAILGYYDQAIDRWNRVIQLSPDPGVRKSSQENIDKARAKVAAAGGGSPQAAGRPPGSGPVADQTRQQARHAYEQGVQQINGRDYASAVQSLSTAIQYEPTLAVAYVARGSANIGLHRYSEAAQDYQYAIRLDPSMGSPLYGLAEAYRAMGRTADARTFYDKYSSSTAADVRPDLQSEARQKADKLR